MVTSGSKGLNKCDQADAMLYLNTRAVCFAENIMSSIYLGKVPSHNLQSRHVHPRSLPLHSQAQARYRIYDVSFLLLHTEQSIHQTATSYTNLHLLWVE